MSAVLLRGIKLFHNSKGSAETYELSVPAEHLDCFIVYTESDRGPKESDEVKGSAKRTGEKSTGCPEQSTAVRRRPRVCGGPRK